MKDIDYVKLYAKELKNNPDLFNQQKRLIESQLHASSSLFSNMFAGKKFKLNARKYLKNSGRIE